jgi:hypothetical protein
MFKSLKLTEALLKVITELVQLVDALLQLHHSWQLW